MSVGSFKLLNGAKMPLIGLGTWQSKPEEVVTAVKTAIDVGYRHIDTAYAYKNEKDIGQALVEKIKEGVVKREDLFIVTKLHCQFLHRAEVVPQLKQQLANLGLSYVDMYLIHSPMGFQKHETDLFPFVDGKPALDPTVDLLDCWKGMEDAFNAGLAKGIGVSNFNAKQVQRIWDNSTVKPMNNQVECHAYFRQEKLHQFCKNLGIAFTAYAPIGSPDRSGSTLAGLPQETKSPMGDSKVNEIAKAHNKTAAQVLLRYLIQRDIIAIPKSVTPARIKQNFEIADFTLSSDEMAAINGLSINKRTFEIQAFASHPEYPFSDEF